MKMKRSVCFLLAMCLTTACLFSLAEGGRNVNVSNMTIEEVTQLRENIYDLTVEALIKLKQSVDEQLIRLGAADYVSLPSGNYLVGRDIAPGMYMITSHVLGYSGNAKITVYKAGETKETFERAYRETSNLAYEYDQAIKAGKQMEKPAEFDKGKYLAMDEIYFNDSGNSVHVTLEEGQTLTVEIWNEMMITIEKSQGLFMD